MAARGYDRILEKLEHTKVLDLEDENSYHIDVLPTPSTIVNAMTGVGGLPRGKMVEIFGPQGCGKTTFSLQMGALIQEINPDAAMLFIDLEQTFDPNYARALGVSMKNSRTTVVRPAFGEQAAQAALASILGNHHDLIVVDSLTTMNTKSYLTGETASIGARARLTSEFLNKILAAMAQSDRQPVIILIDQVRTKIDMINPRGTKVDSSSNNAIDHYVVMKFKLRQQEAMNTGKFDRNQQLAQRYNQYRIRVAITKNKYGGRKDVEGTFVIEEGKGINDQHSVVEMAIDRFATAKGAWYSYKGLTPATTLEQIHGKDTLARTILNTPLLYEEVQERILNLIHEAPAIQEPEREPDVMDNDLLDMIHADKPQDNEDPF